MGAAVSVVVASRNRRQPAPPPEVTLAASPTEVRVKAVERNVETLDFSNAEAVKFLKRAPRRTLMEFGILLPETAWLTARSQASENMVQYQCFLRRG